MGTWGAGGFDNDGALMWFDDLDALGVTAIGSALRVRKGLIDIDDAQAAIAAAECVAAARGHGVKRPPASVVAWLALSPTISTRDHERAAQAVIRVRDRSELTELWNRDEGWARAIASLLARLAAKPKPAKLAKRTKLPPQVHEHSVRSPNGKLVASVASIDDAQTCGVMIGDAGGGGAVFYADCRFDAVTLTWQGNAVLEIAYPAGVTIDQQDPEWRQFRRVVRCRYRAVSTRTRATRPRRSAGRRPPGRARS
ncbi:MAG TPA: DUF4259 domain-containing protein [Kofleriaceae bacterium]|jgi:hypothetical protein|nr:DUF4259 domain-containing protein [Kofleriaceae bacterium]